MSLARAKYMVLHKKFDKCSNSQRMGIFNQTLYDRGYKLSSVFSFPVIIVEIQSKVKRTCSCGNQSDKLWFSPDLINFYNESFFVGNSNTQAMMQLERHFAICSIWLKEV